MKKLLIILAVLLSVATVSAQNYRTEGTKFIVEAGVSPMRQAMEVIDQLSPMLTCSAGYQFNPYLYLGFSTGVCQHFEAVAPFTVDLRYFVLNKKCTPFVSLRFGKFMSLEKACDGLMSIAEIGYQFGRFSISVNTLSRTYIFANDLYAGRMIQLGCGWTF